MNNRANDKGAVIFADIGSCITSHTCNFTQNSAADGAVLATMRKSNIAINNSGFSDNSADFDGGTLYAHTHRVRSVLMRASSVVM